MNLIVAISTPGLLYLCCVWGFLVFINYDREKWNHQIEANISRKINRNSYINMIQF